MKTTIRKTILAITLTSIAAISPSSSHAATAAELLEKGIYQEETKGDP